MRLPKEKIIFTVDWLPVGSLPGRGMIDSYPLEWEESIKKVLAMDWDRLIPGHPGTGGRLGTKKDAQDVLAFLQDTSAEVKKAAHEGKCWDTVEKEMKLPKYAHWIRDGIAVHPEALLRSVGPRHLSRAFYLWHDEPIPQQTAVR